MHEIDKRMLEVLKKENISDFRPAQQKALDAGLLGGNNILVCTPTASGKCMDYNSRVLLSNGRLEKIGDLYNNKNSEELCVLSLNTNNLKIERCRATKVHKIKHDNSLLCIKTGLGNSIRVTPEHPFLVKRNSNLEWMRADSIKVNEFIVVPRFTKTFPEKYVFDKVSILNTFSKGYVDSEDVERLVKKVKKSYRDVAVLLGIDEKDLYRWRKKTAMPIVKFLELSKLSRTNILSKIKYVSDINGMSKLKLPSAVTTNIARFFGLIIADGSIHYRKSAFVAFTNNRVELISEFKRICENEFNIISKAKITLNKSPQEIAYSKVLSELLIYLGIPSGHKSSKVKVPHCIFTQTNKVVASFLSALFDCDGSIYDKGIEYSTDSKELVFEIQTLLLRFGIVSIIKERFFKEKFRYRLFIYRRYNLQLFQKKIGFKQKIKKARLINWLKRDTESTNIDVIPYINGEFVNLRKELGLKINEFPSSFESYVYGWRKNISFHNLKKFTSKYLKHIDNKNATRLKLFAESNIYFDRVISINLTEKINYVYDITVPDNHNFIAENIIVHNTLIAELAITNNILKKGTKAIYIVPLISLATEKYKEFQRKYSHLFKIALSIGDFDTTDSKLIDYDLIICTSEKLDSLIRHKAEWLSRVSVVIIDEIHLLNDPGRGPTLEILITILKTTLKNVQLIGLSATIGNPEELAEWLGAKLVIDNWRPVPLHKGIYHDGKVEFYE